MYYKRFGLSKSEPVSTLPLRQEKKDSVAKYIDIVEKCGFGKYISEPIIPVFRLLNSCFINNKEFNEVLHQHGVSHTNNNNSETIYPFKSKCIGSLASLIYFTKYHGNGVLQEEHNKKGVFSEEIWLVIISIIYNQDWSEINKKVVESLLFGKPLILFTNDTCETTFNFGPNLIMRELLEIIDTNNDAVPFKTVAIAFAFLLLPLFPSKDSDRYFGLPNYLKSKRARDKFYELKRKTRNMLIYIRDMMEFIIFILTEFMSPFE